MGHRSPYRRIDPERLITTLLELEQRLAVVFPDRSLPKLCLELGGIARDARSRVAKLQQPNWPLRAAPLVVLGLVAVVVAQFMNGTTVAKDMTEVGRAFKTLVEHLGLPIAVTTAPLPVFAVAWSVLSLESLWKRRAALRHLHELRSIIHVIDMHQLAKDPRTAKDGAVVDGMTGDELMLYLESCSELMSLSAKIAALYADGSSDPVVIDTVSDLGQITSNLSNKIWQKVNIVERNLAHPVSVQPAARRAGGT
jgi:hypothetical protein